MPFKQVFEKHVNEKMEEEQSKQHSSALEKGPPNLEAEDEELHEKKVRPPRFSTLFGGAPMPHREFESCPVAKRKSGVYIPMPLFVVLMIAFLFESTILFAYTVIGLYNNMPARLVGTVGPACNYEAADRQPAINIAPNFVLPQATQAPVTVTVTALGAAAPSERMPSTTSTTGSSSTTTSTTSTSNTSSEAAAIASNLLGMFSSLTISNLHPITTTSTTATSNPDAATSTLILSEIPQQSTATSIKLITVDLSGSTLQPPSTVTSTTVIIASQAAESSTQAALSALKQNPTRSSVPTSSTTTPRSVVSSAVATALITITPVTPTSTVPHGVSAPPPLTTAAAAATAGVAKGGGKDCFNTLGPVLLGCINE